jgi:hypothetical protein
MHGLIIWAIERKIFLGREFNTWPNKILYHIPIPKAHLGRRLPEKVVWCRFTKLTPTANSPVHLRIAKSIFYFVNKLIAYVQLHRTFTGRMLVTG